MRDALQVLLGVSRALVAVHAAGVIHRDIKPGNVMLVGGCYDDVRVIDLGIARSTSHATQLTATGALLGTPYYMAPEQIRGHADARTDVYAVGATLFETLAGRPPFMGENAGAIVLAVLAEAPPSLHALRTDVPSAIDAVVGRMLAKDPDDRPVDMAAVVSELGQLAAALDRGAAAPVVLSRAERSQRGSTEPPPADAGGILGRHRILAQLDGVLAEVVAERMVALLSITGDPGSGKSAVIDALAQRIHSWRCLRARAYRDQIGVPFSTVRELIKSGGGDAALSALFQHSGGHVDPVVSGDRIMLAWLDRIEAWTDQGPVLVLVDNADLADLSSLRLIDHALAQFPDRCLAVVVTQTGRRTAAIGIQLPEHARVQLSLSPIGDRSSWALARRWAPDASDTARARVVHIASGNPSHLRELCRALERGDEIDARSAADLVWARLASLDPELRRTLRAASIVGRELWPSAVARLLGVSASDPGLSRHLASAVAAGYLHPSAGSRVPDESQFEFTSELAFLAAYELTDDDERRACHQTVADWLAERLPENAILRARHLDAAGAHTAAARHHLAAARAAFAGGDRQLFDDSVARARAEHAPPEIAGEATALLAAGRFWLGATRESLECGTAALGQLPRGSRAWFDATSTAITAAGQLGDHAAIRLLADQVTGTAPSSIDAGEARVIAACRAFCQLAAADSGGELGAALDAVAGSIALDALGPEGRAWRHRVDAWRPSMRGFDQAIGAIVAAHRAHVEHGDLRSAALMGIHLCSYLVWTGAWERAREVIDDAVRLARRLSVDYLVLWGAYGEAKLLVESAPHLEARNALGRVIAGAAASPRIRAGALIYAAIAAAKAGEHALAIEYAGAARTAHSAPVIAAAAAAAMVRSALVLGKRDEATALAHTLEPHATVSERLSEFDELVRLAWAEVAAAQGADTTEAVRAADAAKAAIAARAATLADPLRRNEYLARPHLVVATLALASTRV